MTLMMGKIQSLAESVLTHNALDNIFYRRWLAGPLPLADVEVFARNWTCPYKTGHQLPVKLMQLPSA